MGQDPEQLRAEIADTRRELDQDLNTLAEKVSPGKVVERRVDATKGALMGVKDKVMGVADSGTGALSSAGHSVGGAAGGARTAVADAPATAKQKAAGNPLAAGLVAFGVGWLASSLLPASKAESRAAGQLKEAVAEPVKQQLTTAAQEVKDEVLPAAQEAVESVKGTATEAVGTVKEQAADAAGTVKDQAADSASTVKGQAQDAKDQVQGGAGPTSVDLTDEQDDSPYDAAVARLGDPLSDPLPGNRY